MLGSREEIHTRDISHLILSGNNDLGFHGMPPPGATGPPYIAPLGCTTAVGSNQPKSTYFYSSSKVVEQGSARLVLIGLGHEAAASGVGAAAPPPSQFGLPFGLEPSRTFLITEN
jgi:hypothetical protein